MNSFRKLALLALITTAQMSWSAVTLVDRDGWKVDFGGFVALDMIRDSTQGVGEVIGNSPINRPGTYTGDNPRTQFSAKHTRLSFTINGPEENGWKNKGYIEGDFLGSAQSTAAGGGTEYSFYSNGPFRLRHAYLSTEKDGWKFLAGQASLLFGYVPTYLLATVSVVPGPAQIYQRTAQVQAVKSLELGSDVQVDAGVAITRPTQEDSGIPNLDVGTKWMLKSRKTHMALVSGEHKIEPASLALSGTFRHFKVTDRTATTQSSRKSSAAVSVNMLLPIIPSDDLKGGQSLHLTGSFATGTGYADVLSGWTGNLAKYPLNANDSTNLDAGEGGFLGGTGEFRLLPLQIWSAQLQYHLPSEYRLWMTGGYAQLWTSGIGLLGPAATGRILYDGIGFWFFNVAHDFTARIRGAVEFSRKTVHYTDGVNAKNDRYQVCLLYRF